MKVPTAIAAARQQDESLTYVELIKQLLDGFSFLVSKSHGCLHLNREKKWEEHRVI